MSSRVRFGLLVAVGVCVLAGLAAIFVPRPRKARVPEPAVSGVKVLTRLEAEQVRAKAIRASIQNLNEECQRNAGGDWDRWEMQLAPYRADLKSRILAAKAYNPTAEGSFEGRWPVLEGKDTFPLFECAAGHYLRCVYEPECLDPFRKDRSVVAAARWLKRRNIDLLFVVVPKMTEVYPEAFAEHCPADRIVAPRTRQLLLELLEADVEVVDALPLLQAERDTDAEPLYLPADPHWGPRGQAVVARALGERLKRYDFVATALNGPRVITGVETPYPPASTGAGYLALNPEQRLRADRAQPRTYLSVSNPLSPQSPVMLIGDSYCGGLHEQLTNEINMPVHARIGGGQLTQAFNDFLRDPDLLKDCKVVVWLTSGIAVVNSWPLPQPIRDGVDQPLPVGGLVAP